jgi:hypothetical protein
MTKIKETRFLGLLLATLLCSMTVGCGGGGHDSPEAAFDAWKAAGASKDWNGVCKCMTADSRDAMASSMVITGTMAKMFATMAPDGEKGEEAKAALKAIDEVFKKHGIDEDAMKKMQEKRGGKKPDGPEEALAMLKELAAPIKDKPAFIGEMFAELDKLNDDASLGLPFENATLKDLEVDGDTAMATIVKNTDGVEKSNAIAFKKVDGGWLIDIPMERMMSGSGGTP